MTVQRIMFDSEFDEDGETIRPLSLGFYAPCACSDPAVCSRCMGHGGLGLYVVIQDADHSRVNGFVREHVLPYLYDVTPSDNLKVIYVDRKDAGSHILQWIRAITPSGFRIEFWANFAAYDWVVFAQLFGDMNNFPFGLPQMANDLKQELIRRGYMRKTEIPESLSDGLKLHNAYDDALWNYRVWEWLNGS